LLILMGILLALIKGKGNCSLKEYGTTITHAGLSNHYFVLPKKVILNKILYPESVWSVKTGFNTKQAYIHLAAELYLVVTKKMKIIRGTIPKLIFIKSTTTQYT